MSIPEAETDPRSAQSQIPPLLDTLVRKKGLCVSKTELDGCPTPQHLISQCPDDILQVIFEALVTVSDLLSSKQSVRLSSVCRHWRAVALRTPRLWTRVLLDLSAPIARRDFIRTQIIPRSKHVPTEVVVDALESLYIESMGASGIQDIPQISELTLRLTTPRETHLFFNSQFKPPAGNLHSLRIISSMPTLTSITQVAVIYDISLLLKRFPPFSKLEIRATPRLKFAIGTRNSSITSLYLISMGRVEIDVVLAALPNLAFLRICSSAPVLQGRQDGIVRFPSLKTLIVSPVVGQEWLALVGFPRLEHLECHGPTVAILRFISTHPTITSLQFKFIGPTTIANLARAAPQLTDLTIMPVVTGKYIPLTADSKLPFPRLKSLLILASNAPKYPTMIDFDTLVRARFLPVQHPKSLVKHLSYVIPTLRIRCSTGFPAEWCESELYKESRREIEEKSESGLQTIRFSWSEGA